MKKKYEIIRATTGPLDSIIIGKNLVKFPRNGQLVIDDPVKATEIRQRYGKQVVICEVDKTLGDRGYARQFVSPGMPWHQYDELGRIKRGSNAITSG